MPDQEVSAALMPAEDNLEVAANLRRGITPDTAIRLGAYLGNEPQFWLNLQSAHDLSRLEAEKGEEIRAQVRRPAA